VGQAYHVRALADILNGATIAFQYLGEAVPAGMEPDLTIYHRNSDGIWESLPTKLSILDNFASAPLQGPGLYTLLTAYQMPLDTAGWNLLWYPCRDPLPVPAALASIEDHYIIYGYDATDTADPWKVYDETAPPYVNDLTALEFGQGYWIHVPQPTTVYFGCEAETGVESVASLPPKVPATYYGEVWANEAFTPSPGETVRAWVGATECGQGQTLEVGGQVVYTINVIAEVGGKPGCGVEGREVAFLVGSQRMLPRAVWNDSQLWDVTLSGSFTRYLPIVLKLGPN
jgi:hypothetical protein